MILTIVKYPDPVLARPGEPISEFNAELRKLVADMFETMYDGQGIGLAAQQVGVAKRLLVIDLSVGKVPEDKLVLINPEIIFTRGQALRRGRLPELSRYSREGVRAAKVRIRAQDEYGKWFEMDGEDLLSRCFQHEIDHLDGMLFIFRMSALKRDLICARFARCSATASGRRGRELKLVFCGTPQFAVPTLEALARRRS